MTLAQAYKKQFGEVSFPFEVFDARGNQTYYETSKGYWSKREYNANGNEIYFEDSDGHIEGQRQSSCNGKVVEIDGKKYELKELA